MFGQNKRPSLPENDQVPTEDGQILQLENKIEKVQHRRPRPSKSDPCNKGPSARQARTKLGRTLQGCPLLLPRKLSPVRSRREQVTSSMERGAPKEVLQIETVIQLYA